jgi:hypothetical protein
MHNIHTILYAFGKTLDTCLLVVVYIIDIKVYTYILYCLSYTVGVFYEEYFIHLHSTVCTIVYEEKKKETCILIDYVKYKRTQ